MRGKVEFTANAQTFTFLLQNSPYDIVQITEKSAGAVGADSWKLEWLDEDAELHEDPISPVPFGFGVLMFDPAPRFRALKVTFNKDTATAFFKVKTFQSGREDVDPTSAYTLLSRALVVADQANLSGD